jgi:hypothetical protein
MAFGQTKDCSLKFVNSTGMTINIPREGHRVKNPGGLEGWNKMELGTAINGLAPGDDRTVTQDLNIKDVDDAQFEIHYSAEDGRDFTQLFSNRDIRDKHAVLTLTRH